MHTGPDVLDITSEENMKKHKQHYKTRQENLIRARIT